MHNYAVAADCFQEAAKLNPSYWPYNFHLAMTYVASGDSDLALRATATILEAHVNREAVRTATSNVLTFKSTPEDADRNNNKVQLPIAEVHLLR